MDQKNNDFMVGLFVIAGALALLFMALKAGNLASLDFGTHIYEVRAKFDNIGGLKKRASVRSAGVVVGRVERIDFDNKSYQAVATLAITDRYHFPRDTAAKILTSGLLGEQYVGLDPGGDPDMLAAGDQIENTQSAVVLENLIGQFLFSKAAEGKPGDNAGGDAQPGAAAPPGKPGEPLALPVAPGGSSNTPQGKDKSK